MHFDDSLDRIKHPMDHFVTSHNHVADAIIGGVARRSDESGRRRDNVLENEKYNAGRVFNAWLEHYQGVLKHANYHATANPTKLLETMSGNVPVYLLGRLDNFVHDDVVYRVDVLYIQSRAYVRYRASGELTERADLERKKELMEGLDRPLVDIKIPAPSVSPYDVKYKVVDEMEKLLKQQTQDIAHVVANKGKLPEPETAKKEPPRTLAEELTRGAMTTIQATDEPLSDEARWANYFRGKELFYQNPFVLQQIVGFQGVTVHAKLGLLLML